MVNKPKKRTVTVDGDFVEVSRVYDPDIQTYFDEYPDFQVHPRSTPDGKPWVNATYDECPYADKAYGDCGSCEFFRSERPDDLIGVCDNEAMRVAKECAV